MSVLNLNVHTDRLFFGESGHGISRYDVVRYPVLNKLNKHMRSLFWEPEVVSMASERRSFNSMTDAEQFVFTSNLKRQILLDAVQGRAPALVFMPSCTDPTLENCLSTWSFFETIHSESYTHIIRAVYPDPESVINSIPDISEIADCARAISKAYDDAVSNPTKETIYLALIAANALEALRFHVSFACTFNFKERKLVPGSGDIMRLIARDETQHLALTQHILKILPKDDPEFITIAADCRSKALEIYDEARDQEKEWGRYLLSKGPNLGLTEGMFDDYIDHLHAKQTRAIGLTTLAPLPSPFRFMTKYTTGADSIQAAPQEDGSVAYKSASSVLNDLDSFIPVLT
jgi:ribonucleoside-diphosphate reductase beta chain